jgi:hypothetical protein
VEENTNEVKFKDFELTGINSIDTLIEKYNATAEQYDKLKDMFGMSIVCDSLLMSIDVLSTTIDKEISKLSQLKGQQLNVISNKLVDYLNNVFMDGDNVDADIIAITQDLFKVDNNCNGIILKFGMDGKFVVAGKTTRTASGKIDTSLNYTERYKLTELTKYDVNKTFRDGTVKRAGFVYVGTDNRIIWDSVNGSQYTSPTKFWATVAGLNAGIHSLNEKCFTNIGIIDVEKFNALWDKLTK